MRCRWANGASECGGACEAFKYGRLDEVTDTMAHKGHGKVKLATGNQNLLTGNGKTWHGKQKLSPRKVKLGTGN